MSSEVALQTLVNGVALGCYLGLMAMGLSLIFGILRVVNFTHGVMFTFGAYSVWYLTSRLEMGYALALAASAVAIGLLGVVLDLLIFRRFRGLVLEGAVAAILLSLVLVNVGNLFLPLTHQNVRSPFTTVLHIGSAGVSSHRLFVVICAFVIVAALMLFIAKTRTGRAIRALQQDPYAAQLQGIEVGRISPLVWAIGAGLAGLAGGIVAPLQQLTVGMGDAPLLNAFVVVILGGMGSIGGAFAAALLIGVAQAALTTLWSPPLAVAVSYLAAMLVLVVRPTGLFGHE